jgi:hypothetical protein
VRKARRNSLKSGVARLMSMRIVDALEIVQIQEHHGKDPPMPLSLGDSVFQPILEERSVRQAGQIVMQGGLPGAFLLFHDRGQLMIHHGSISDFYLQSLIHLRQCAARFLQQLHNGFILLESIIHSRQWFAVWEGVHEAGIDRGQILGGLLYQFVYVLGTPKHQGEQITQHGMEFRVQIGSAS